MVAAVPSFLAYKDYFPSSNSSLSSSFPRFPFAPSVRSYAIWPLQTLPPPLPPSPPSSSAAAAHIQTNPSALKLWVILVTLPWTDLL